MEKTNIGNIMKTKTFNHKYVLTNSNLFDSIKKRVQTDHLGATVFVPHVCNNIDLFGAGFAAQVAKHYPIVKDNYHMLGKNFLKNNFGYSQLVKVYTNNKYKHKLYFVNMIAQNGTIGSDNRRPLNYLALAKSMNSLAQTINSCNHERIEIHCPKFGSGLAGGNWNFISDLIEDIWGKYNVFVYEYKPQRS